MFRKLLNLRSANAISARITNLKSRNYCSLKDDYLDSYFDKARKSAIRASKSLPVFDYNSKYAECAKYRQAKFIDDCLFQGIPLVVYARDIDAEWRRYFKVDQPSPLCHGLDLPRNEYYGNGYALRFSSVEKFLIQQEEKPADTRELIHLYEVWCEHNNMVPYPAFTFLCKFSGNCKSPTECGKGGWEPLDLDPRGPFASLYP